MSKPNHKAIFAKHFKQGMKGGTFEDFERSHPTLLKVILRSMDEISKNIKPSKKNLPDCELPGPDPDKKYIVVSIDANVSSLELEKQYKIQFQAIDDANLRLPIFWDVVIFNSKFNKIMNLYPKFQTRWFTYDEIKSIEKLN